jgi:hypothetical protein
MNANDSHVRARVYARDMPFTVFTMFNSSAKALKSLQNTGERLLASVFTGEA